MGNPNFDAQFICQFLQVFFENIVPRTIATTAIAERHYRSGIRIEFPSILKPPGSQAITGKLTGILTCTPC